jgi:cytidyltransferase-like protein
MESNCMVPSRKICNLLTLLALREEARASGKTVVHCHGCFDIVHPGHIAHLQFARSLGDLLIVSVSADQQVNKGADRPLIPQELRAGSLAALECVVAVLVNGDATVVLGEGVRLFEVRVPPSLAGQPLSMTGIGSRTGLSVVAMEDQRVLTTQLTGETMLPTGATLLMLGNADQRQQFAEAFERASG